MPEFSEENARALLALATFVGAAALPFLFRLAFGRRRRKGRSRAFVSVALALGRQRRLVLLRTAGAERLLLLGEKSDLAVEADVAAAAPPPAEEPQEPSQLQGLFPLGLVSLFAGVAVGTLCGAFRLALDAAGRLRSSIPDWFADRPLLGVAIMAAGAALAAGLAAFLVRRFVPAAVGSGIPHVESVIDGDEPPSPPLLLPVKFVGGLLAIGAGLALGREGPSVQMGATLAHQFGRYFRYDWRDQQSLLAAGAGAGLAAAFNAPLAGAAFVLEELLRRFDMRHATIALGASVGAISVVRLMDGPTPELSVATHYQTGTLDVPLGLALGAAMGLASLAYNRAILGALDIADRSRWPAETKAALVGAGVGAIGFLAPDLVGGGDNLTQKTLDGAFALDVLPLVFALRFALGVVSYAAGTPGGLFAPLLALGAEIGLFFGLLIAGLFIPGEDAQAMGMKFALIGMAAFFAAVVRAPLTGMILITEMTDNSELLLPMLAACFSAMAIAAVCRNEPIYDALKDRSARLARRAET
ncbi:H(+)/Cl(-) exchange transporter ClcA [Methylosinus sporium]|uniref:H(+)/Cl(-) exchange transporter ClcA n=1 Tax=Methylosinus sporium TaxID=428 RepID=A0A549T2V5_METSR|nr:MULTISPECIES: H(+)/Cl(-) exchange transporter ClcA [Methylosinus]MBU3889476.1 H(+)/Cl(-) exchange transporter ClcA [Methylosinus sp. KRF6]TRL36206.1 H(+)/Cl(-) exchange transporter ClcA [Methylosinus sporium]